MENISGEMLVIYSERCHPEREVNVQRPELPMAVACGTDYTDKITGHCGLEIQSPAWSR